MTEILLTYMIHSTLILGVAWSLVHLPGLRRAETRALLLKSAMLASAVMPLVPGVPETLRFRPDAFTRPMPQEALAPAQAFEPAPRSTSERTEPAPEPTAGPAAARPGPGRPLPWSELALAAVAAFVLAALVRMAVAVWQLRRVIRSSTAPGNGRLLALMARAAVAAGAGGRIRWLQAAPTASPITVGLATVVLPEGLLDRLGRVRTQAVLVHEVAHLRRRDPLWNVGLSFLAHALAFQPLNILMLRGWRAAAEEACDAIAADGVGDRRATASSLVELARRRTAETASVVAAAGAGAGSRQLAARVQALLVRRPTRLVRWHGALGLVLLIAVGLVAPPIGLAQEQDPAQEAPRPLVVLDPGHGGEDPGVRSDHGAEKDLTLAVAVSVRDRLVAQGFDVVLTRTTDANPTPAERAGSARGASAFVSLHTAAHGDPAVAGVRTYMPVSPPGAIGIRGLDVLADARRLAEGIHGHVVTATGARDAGVHVARFGVLDAVEVPAAWIEFGHQTNLQEDARVWTEAYQDSVSEAIAMAVVAFVQGGHDHAGATSLRQVEAERPEQGSTWLWMTVVGGVSFDAAQGDLLALTPGGSAIFEERLGDRVVWLEASMTEEALALDHRVDGRVVDDEGETRRWLAGFLVRAFGSETPSDGDGQLASRTVLRGWTHTRDRTTFSYLQVPARTSATETAVARLIEGGIELPGLPTGGARWREPSPEAVAEAELRALHAVAHGLLGVHRLPSVLARTAAGRD